MPEWLDGIQDTCRRLELQVLPQSAMGKAIHYTVNQWEKLMVTINDGEIELSTNVAENSMRPVALGRKNWLHIGSQKAGPKVAAILSLVESCRRLRIPVKDYLCDLLPGPTQPVDESSCSTHPCSLGRRPPLRRPGGSSYGYARLSVQGSQPRPGGPQRLGQNHVYDVVNRRYERKPLIVTTNRPFKEWNEVFPNATCIVTLLDR